MRDDDYDDRDYAAERAAYQAEEAAEREFRHYEREISRLRALIRAHGINPDTGGITKEAKP